ncbi:MAG: hypothetical protein AAB467_00255 [Patescibacteria group bacterium]
MKQLSPEHKRMQQEHAAAAAYDAHIHEAGTKVPNQTSGEVGKDWKKPLSVARENFIDPRDLVDEKDLPEIEIIPEIKN